MRSHPARLVAGITAVALTLVPATIVAQSPAGSPTAGSPTAASPAVAITVTDADGNPVTIGDTSRVVTLGGVITETAFALGAGDQIVGVDASSTQAHDQASTRTVVPYYRMLSAEPVIALGPTLVLGTDEVGPADVVQLIRDAGVPTLLLPQELTTDGTVALITAVGRALGRDAEAAALIETLHADLAAARDLVAGATASPTVMFLLLPPGAPLLVSGTGTEADTMIGLAGATNAVSAFPGYVPLTPEAAVAAAPEIILTTTASLEAAGGIDGLLALPGISDTPAGAARAIVAMDDLELLSFGPRTGQAIAALAVQLHPELAR